MAQNTCNAYIYRFIQDDEDDEYIYGAYDQPYLRYNVPLGCRSFDRRNILKYIRETYPFGYDDLYIVGIKYRNATDDDAQLTVTGSCKPGGDNPVTNAFLNASRELEEEVGCSIVNDIEHYSSERIGRRSVSTIFITPTQVTSVWMPTHLSGGDDRSHKIEVVMIGTHAQFYSFITQITRKRKCEPDIEGIALFALSDYVNLI